MEYVAYAALAVSTISQVQAGAAQKSQYQQMARQTEIQARSDIIKSRQQELRYKEDGVAILRKINRNLATINSRGAAGALDPFSGSTGNLMTSNLNQGYIDFSLAQDNSDLARQNQNIIQGAASYQAGIYRAAGRQAQRSAVIGAVTSAGTGAYSINKMK